MKPAQKLKISGVLLTLAASAFLAGCPSKSSTPTQPSAPTDTPTITFTPTITGTPTRTATPTITSTPTLTGTPTSTATSSPTRTPTSSPTVTFTPTETGTPTLTGTPTNTGTSTSTFTVTPTYTPFPGVYWNDAIIANSRYQQTPGVGYFNAEINLSVNGNAETSDSVTVILPSTTPVPLLYNYTSSFQNGSYADYYWDLSAYGSFQAGATYIVVANTSAGSSSATIVAAGGISVSSDGLTCTWQKNGDNNTVLVGDPGGATGFSDNPLASPENIPTTVYSGPGTYTVYTDILALNATFHNAAPGSSLWFDDTLRAYIVK